MFESIVLGPSLVALFVAFCSGLVTIGMWIGNVNSDRKSFKEFMKKMDQKADADRRMIWELMKEIKILMLQRSAPSMSEGKSPLRLSELGRQISEQLNAKAWADQHLEQAKQATANMSTYDIQTFCFSYATLDKFTEEEQQIIKQISFDNAITTYDTVQAYAYELRDKLLAARGTLST